MSKDELGVAVVGLGGHAVRNAIPALRQCRGVRLVGLYSRSLERVRAQAEELGCHAYAEPEEMLADPEVEVLYLSPTSEVHAAWCRRGLESGKHVWCEKPLATNLEDALGLVRLARESQLSLEECFAFLYHPLQLKLRSILKEGVLGPVRSLRSRFGFPHLPDENFRYRKELGGGAFLDAACYPLKMAADLLGRAPVRVRGWIGSQAGRQVDTDGSAQLEFEDKVALLEWGLGRAYCNEVEIWGELGLLRAARAFSKPPSHRPEIEIRRSDGSVERIEIEGHNHFVAMFEAFRERLGRPDLDDLQGYQELYFSVLENSFQQVPQ